MLNGQRGCVTACDSNCNHVLTPEKNAPNSVYAPNIYTLLSSLQPSTSKSSTCKLDVPNLNWGEYSYDMQEVDKNNNNKIGNFIHVDNDGNNSSNTVTPVLNRYLGNTVVQYMPDSYLSGASTPVMGCRFTESSPVRTARKCILEYDDANNPTPVRCKGPASASNCISRHYSADFGMTEFDRAVNLQYSEFEPEDDEILNRAALLQSESGSNMSPWQYDHSILESQALEMMLDDITQSFGALTESFTKSSNQVLS